MLVGLKALAILEMGLAIGVVIALRRAWRFEPVVERGRYTLRAGKGLISFLGVSFLLALSAGAALLWSKGGGMPVESALAIGASTFTFGFAFLTAMKRTHELHREHLTLYGLWGQRTWALSEFARIDLVPSLGGLRLTAYDGSKTIISYDQSGVSELLEVIRRRCPHIEGLEQALGSSDDDED